MIPEPEEWWLPSFKPGELYKLAPFSNKPSFYSESLSRWIKPVDDEMFVCVTSIGGMAELMGLCFIDKDYQTKTKATAIIRVINVGDSDLAKWKHVVT